MRFPNAYEGVSKIFLAEILSLVSSLVIVAGVGLALGGAATFYNGGSIDVAGGLAVGGIVVTLGGLVLPIIGSILQIVGLGQARKDERKCFKTAFIAAIIALVASCASAFTTGIDWLTTVLTLVAGFANIFAFAFTIYGITELAGLMKRQDMVILGNKIVWMVAIIYIMSFIAKVLPLAQFGTVLLIASGILAIVAYIVFLVYLYKGKKMLAD